MTPTENANTEFWAYLIGKIDFDPQDGNGTRTIAMNITIRNEALVERYMENPRLAYGVIREAAVADGRVPWIVAHIHVWGVHLLTPEETFVL